MTAQCLLSASAAVATGLQHEEAMAAAHAEHHAGPGKGKALGDPFDDSGGRVPKLLQDIDERDATTPWWMEPSVVACIEAAEKVPQGDAEPAEEAGGTGSEGVRPVPGHTSSVCACDCAERLLLIHSATWTEVLRSL